MRKNKNSRKPMEDKQLKRVSGGATFPPPPSGTTSATSAPAPAPAPAPIPKGPGL